MSQPLRLLMDRLKTPIGQMLIVADERGSLRCVGWDEHEDRMLQSLRLHYGKDGFKVDNARDPGGLTQAMRRYFDGELTVIDALRVETAGTAFQQQVWRALREIPCGTTTTYGELARRIGRPAAIRAVGAANGSNPVGVVVPCHRVIGANGTLTGYGGGMERKSWLLQHEGARTESLFTQNAQKLGA